VTKVEEWTKEETGVGAAIAAGSQAEKGTCALLVIAPKNKKTKNKGLSKSKSHVKEPPQKKKKKQIRKKNVSHPITENSNQTRLQSRTIRIKNH